MECRPGCGACCISPSISSPLPGMPDGKPSGVRCFHLSDEHLCLLFGKPERPEVCEQFSARPEICGSHRDEALVLLTVLEIQTRP